MKTTLLLPLLLGLLVTGCTRSTSSTKTASTSANHTQAAKDAVLTHPSTDESLAMATEATATTTPVRANPSIPTFNESATPSVSVNLTPLTPTPENVPLPDEKMAVTSDAVSPVMSDPTDVAAPGDASTLAARIAEWRLAPQDIASDILMSDRIERTKASEAGAPTGTIDSGMITDLIAGKFQGDSMIASRKFNIMVVGDTATLTGTAQSFDQIGRAMALALDTEGIARVVSRIKPDPTAP